MKKQHPVLCIAFACILVSCTKNALDNNPAAPDAVPAIAATANIAAVPVPPFNKVAYYAFDATPNQLPLTNFAKEANIVVLFEGTGWEMADSVHYGSSSSYILNVNPNYHSYRSIIDHVRVLQARGVKVLMNVDDAASWNTTQPFTTYNGTKLNYVQFAAFVKACIVDSLHFDGIALDVEHMGSTPANTNFTNLVKEFGKYFGPKSNNPANTIYTAAIYSGGQAGYAIGQSPAVAQYLNFVEDMGYFQNNITRFNRWANSIGAAKTMIGVSKQYNSLSNAMTAATWEPAGATKAGIMVFAGNVDSSYTNRIFRAIQ
ncbi:hypothetical protein F0L74_17560 [Chitinophaga agrisoli]|uniref:mannosyl-glycoprotein endo-beta-N-acetylglucosaminidase n=1 Tax=Chitinophaga agrisoli TaxID=2607653 RepID=A0A5B2VS66_9BACT|nr:glycosyl hydrolase family 18 protein [Chitinophaga agrisoli]KAA2241684.1 hypothetical protein F0L74_17560 [Chitinophaga agrisoli]